MLYRVFTFKIVTDCHCIKLWLTPSFANILKHFMWIPLKILRPFSIFYPFPSVLPYSYCVLTMCGRSLSVLNLNHKCEPSIKRMGKHITNNCNISCQSKNNTQIFVDINNEKFPILVIKVKVTHKIFNRCQFCLPFRLNY